MASAFAGGLVTSPVANRGVSGRNRCEREWCCGTVVQFGRRGVIQKRARLSVRMSGERKDGGENKDFVCNDDTLKRLIKNFVTQRALQTLVFYYETLAQGTLAEYLERFNGHDGISRYHGFHGLKSNWDEYVRLLLNDEPFDVVVKKPARRQGTKGNPYIKQKYFSYTEHIQPSKIARKLLEVRASVAAELSSDLTLVARENDELELHYRDALVGSDHESEGHAATLSALCDHDPAFNANTPLRGGTCDLVLRMATWCGTKRVCERESNRRERDYLNSFLQSQGRWFLDDAVPKYNVGKSFLRELMDEAPVLHAEQGQEKLGAEKASRRSANKLAAVVPLDLAHRIMQARSDIAARWKEILEQDTDSDHLDLQQEFLKQSL